jgi:hypothetical protein
MNILLKELILRANRLSLICIGIIFLQACASSGSGFSPIVDKKGLDEMAYQRDLLECQGLSQETGATGKTVATQAAGGAAVGALLGLVGGGNKTGIAQTAGIGGVIGGASGAYSGTKEKEMVIRRCLNGRGYRVLN